ncbi:MAG: hypothetical protein HFH40_05900 [Lachnospiraceae bacterium]|nr:hypothetical protein [Lachnospiraceae bacterium]
MEQTENGQMREIILKYVPIVRVKGDLCTAESMNLVDFILQEAVKVVTE